jgi:hypothetical protein
MDDGVEPGVDSASVSPDGGWPGAGGSAWVGTSPVPATQTPLPMARRGRLGSRRRRLAAAVAVLALVATGGGVAATLARDRAQTSATPTASPSVDPERAAQKARDAAIEAALGTLNAALSADDEDMFLSVVHPDATEFRKRQRQTFRAFQIVPVGEVSYALADSSSFRTSNFVAEVPGESVLAMVARTYDLPGWDAQRATEVVGLTFVKSGERWLLADDDDGNGTIVKFAYGEPWTAGPVRVVTRKHVLVIGDMSAARLKRLAGQAEAVIGEVRRTWPTESWSGKAVIYAMTDKRFVKAWFGDSASRDDDVSAKEPAAFDAQVGPVPANVRLTDRARFDIAGFRLVTTPFLLKQDDRYVRKVLTHELTHVATAGMGGKYASTWVVEGAAEYTAHRNGPSVDGAQAMFERGMQRSMWNALRRSDYRPRLEADPERFYTGTSRQVGTRYDTSWLAVMYIADHYGEAKLRTFVERVYTGADTAAGAREAEEAAFAKVLKVKRSRFLREVGAYARGLRSNFV